MQNFKSVIAVGCSLAFMAAAVNVTFLLLVGVSVGHLTGDLARFSADLVNSNIETEAIRYLFAALSGFFIGASLSGFFIHHPKLELSRPYGRSISAIGILLISAYFSFNCSKISSIFLSAIGCGFQNALATHYKGMILRTTHITGLFTDFGIFIGMKLKGHEIDTWKILAQILFIGAFFWGTLTGAILLHKWNEKNILIFGVLYLLGGLSYSLYKHSFFKF